MYMRGRRLRDARKVDTHIYVCILISLHIQFGLSLVFFFGCCCWSLFFTFLSFGHVILFVCVRRRVYRFGCSMQCSFISDVERKQEPTKKRNKRRERKKNGKEETSTQNHTCSSTLRFNRMRNDDSDDAKKEMALRHVYIYIYTEIGKIRNIIHCLAYFLLLLLLLLHSLFLAQHKHFFGETKSHFCLTPRKNLHKLKVIVIHRWNDRNTVAKALATKRKMNLKSESKSMKGCKIDICSRPQMDERELCCRKNSLLHWK